MRESKLPKSHAKVRECNFEARPALGGHLFYRLMTHRIFWMFLLACSLTMGAVHAQGFKFSEEEKAEKEQEAQGKAKVQALLDTPCKAKLKNQKIMVLIGQSQNGYINAAQSGFSPHFDAINRRLQSVGLKTVTQAQIQSQVKQAEIDAYFKNDADAALSASQRMQAQYVLRGLISTSATYNRMVNVNQVSISMAFTLTNASGKVLSQASAESASYAGQDTSGMALTLINEQADEVVAQLYSDYCGKSNAR